MRRRVIAAITVAVIVAAGCAGESESGNETATTVDQWNIAGWQSLTREDRVFRGFAEDEEVMIAAYNDQWQSLDALGVSEDHCNQARDLRRSSEDLISGSISLGADGAFDGEALSAVLRLIDEWVGELLAAEHWFDENCRAYRRYVDDY